MSDPRDADHKSELRLMCAVCIGKKIEAAYLQGAGDMRERAARRVTSQVARDTIEATPLKPCEGCADLGRVGGGSSCPSSQMMNRDWLTPCPDCLLARQNEPEEGKS